MQSDNSTVIYDHRTRWLAVINLAFFVTFIWVALQFLSGLMKYSILVFCFAFCLFWIRDFIFGFRVRLLSDGCTLHWQEGKEAGSVLLTDIRKVLIGAQNSIRIGSWYLNWNYVRLQLENGEEHNLPPNIATGLRSRRWQNLKKLVAHIRTVSNVTVEPIMAPNLTTADWEDESDVTKSS